MIVICNYHKKCVSETCDHKVPHEYRPIGDACTGTCMMNVHGDKIPECVVYIPDFINKKEFEI